LRRALKKTVALFLVLVLTLAVSACARKPKTENPPEIGGPPQAEMVTLTLYFGDRNAEFLRPELRKIPKPASLPEAIVRELIKGPARNDLVRTVPTETELLAIEVKEGIAYVDFSDEIQTRHPGGSTGESFTVNSIVNSLTELPEIKQVVFLVEGKQVETLVGHLDLSEPLRRVESVIRR
jgi:germination protein M